MDNEDDRNKSNIFQGSKKSPFSQQAPFSSKNDKDYLIDSDDPNIKLSTKPQSDNRSSSSQPQPQKIRYSPSRQKIIPSQFSAVYFLDLKASQIQCEIQSQHLGLKHSLKPLLLHEYKCSQDIFMVVSGVVENKFNRLNTHVMGKVNQMIKQVEVLKNAYKERVRQERETIKAEKEIIKGLENNITCKDRQLKEKIQEFRQRSQGFQSIVNKQFEENYKQQFKKSLEYISILKTLINDKLQQLILQASIRISPIQVRPQSIKQTAKSFISQVDEFLASNQHIHQTSSFVQSNSLSINSLLGTFRSSLNHLNELSFPSFNHTILSKSHSQGEERQNSRFHNDSSNERYKKRLREYSFYSFEEEQ